MHASTIRAVRIATIAGLIGAVASSAAERAEKDHPLKVIQTTRLDFGHLPADGSVPTSGEVRMLVLIDSTGQLHDLLLLGSTHQVFTKAAVAGLQEWRYVPPQVQGQPVGARATLRLFIESRGRFGSVSIAEAVADRVRLAPSNEFESRLAKAGELDHPLELVRRTTPVLPVELAGQARESSRVVLDFYIDETGKPRMPMVKESTEPLLSAAALDALAEWQFAPPTRRGMPVIVRAQQEFVFFEDQQTEETTPAESATDL